MAADPSFRMTIVDTFAITGRGTVVVGHIESGEIKVMDEMFVNRQAGGGSTKVHVIGIQAGAKTAREARAGDNVGVVLRGIDVGAVTVGDLLSAAKTDG